MKNKNKIYYVTYKSIMGDIYIGDFKNRKSALKHLDKIYKNRNIMLFYPGNLRITTVKKQNIFDIYEKKF